MNVNVYCGVYYLLDEVMCCYENVCISVVKFINVKVCEEVIWMLGIIEVINIVVNGFGQLLSEGDEVMVIEFEYYVNLVIW